jgi:CheY-like chemotaxis protein
VRPRLVVIDGDAVRRARIQLAIERSGHAAEPFARCDEALAAIRGGRGPVVALLATPLEGADDLLARLEAEPSLRRVQVVLLTDDRRGEWPAPVAACLRPPVSVSSLLRAVEQLLRAK